MKKSLTERYKMLDRYHLDQLHSLMSIAHEKAEEAETDDDAQHVASLIADYQNQLHLSVLDQAVQIAKTAQAFLHRGDSPKGEEQFLRDVETLAKVDRELLGERPRTLAEVRKWSEDFWEHRSSLIFAISDIQEYLKQTGRPLKHDPESALSDPDKRLVKIGPFKVLFVGDAYNRDTEARIRAAIKLYVRRVKRVFPRALQHMPPLEVHSLLKASGLYHHGSGPGKARISLTAFRARPIDDAKTLAHELGHHIYQTVLSSQGQALWKQQWKAILPKLKGKYAATNPEEGFCEAFGMLVAYGPRTLDPEVRHVLKTIVPGLKIESSLFNDEERNRLLEAIPGGMPKAIDLMGQAKAIEFTGATIGRKPNAFVVYALRPNGTRHEVASYYYQDDKPRAKRHAKWDATITLKSLKRTLGLTEATYEVDAKARAQANKIWDSIVAYVKGLDNDYDSVVWTRDGMMTIYPAHTEVPYGMKVYLAPRGHNSGYGSGVHGHVLVVGGALMHPKDPTYLDTRITSPKLRAYFAHEYVHHLDHMRRGKLANRAAQKAGLKGDMAGYLRNPEEFNAQFQETAQLVEDEFAGKLRIIEKFLHMGKPALAERTLKKLQAQFATFQAFMKSAEAHNETDVIMRAVKGTKWERKWLKRMTTLYHALKVRVPSRVAVAQ